jgi:hypothetical protein
MASIHTKLPQNQSLESAFTFTYESFKTMNPIEKCIQKAAIVFEHISSKGGDGGLFWGLVLLVLRQPSTREEFLLKQSACEPF